MSERSSGERAIDLLKRLGLKEYEAQCFVALTRLPQGTAKRISEISDVPRTRVYDAIGALEAKGLVEVQHSSPQQFRAVGVDEAVDTLRSEYEGRLVSLRDTLGDIEPAGDELDDAFTHDVWTLTGETSITNRACQLVDAAERDVLLIVGDQRVVTEALIDSLCDAAERGVDVVVATTVEGLRERLGEAIPGQTLSTSGLDWIDGVVDYRDDPTELGYLLLVDDDSSLVSSLRTAEVDGDGAEECAVFGEGVHNGLVTVVRRLLSRELESNADQASGDA